ncbi:hypothetical protein BDV93DRAFT_515126 [Ceratobasidium sp. AG-I]|nr:hypothetical protein BDV93DRAFT_515126 [Ceratobasidium sp. AG-I]
MPPDNESEQAYVALEQYDWMRDRWPQGAALPSLLGYEPRLAEPTRNTRRSSLLLSFIMSYFFEPGMPQFPRLAENGNNYETWRQHILAVLELIDLGDFVAAGMKGMARENVLAPREVCSHLTPALIAYAIDFSTTRDLWTALATQFAPGAPEAQPHDQPRHRTAEHTKEGGNGQGDATGMTNDRPGDRVEAYAHDAKTPSIQIAPADVKCDVHKPRAMVAMVHDELERNQGGTRTYTTPTTPDVVPTSLDDPAIDLDVFDASKTPNSTPPTRLRAIGPRIYEIRSQQCWTTPGQTHIGLERAIYAENRRPVTVLSTRGRQHIRASKPTAPYSLWTKMSPV